MPAFVVLREFRVKPGALEEFLAAAADDARNSLAEELGCRQFDILRPDDQADTVIFYQVYDDRAAFDAHLGTEHIARFRDARAALAEEVRATLHATRAWP